MLLRCCLRAFQTNDQQAAKKHQQYHERLFNTYPLVEFDRKYEFLDKLGKGGFGTVRRARNRITGVNYAVKICRLGQVDEDHDEEERQNDFMSIKKELDILQKLDHPNIVKVFEVFTAKKVIYLVEQCCTGGELSTRSPFTEARAAEVFTDVLRGIKYLHAQDIMHRDIKVENIMFLDDADDAPAVLIDFGAAKYLPYGKVYRRFGTPYTCAPEVIYAGGYSFPCDLWSAGVVLYMLLNNMIPPFRGTNDSLLYKSIRSGKYDTTNPHWRKVTPLAKDLVSKLLELNPDKRFTVDQALAHEWLSAAKDSPPPTPVLGSQELIRNLKHYRSEDVLKKQSLILVSHKATPSELAEMRKLFNSFDKSNDGYISLEEFKQGLEMHGNLSEEEITSLFSSVDINNAGTLSYSEFLAATMDLRTDLKMTHLADVFSRLDVNGDGVLNMKEFKRYLTKEMIDKSAKTKILKQAKKDGLTWESFVQMMLTNG